VGSPWQEVGDECFRRRYESYDLNVGVVRGSEGLLIFDTRCHDGEARELLEEVSCFGDRPIRWVVNSHCHFDHTFGNAAIARAVPRVEIWGHRVMRDELLRWSDHTRRNLIAERPEWRADLEAVVITPPDHLVDDVADVDLDLGDRTVRLRHFGRAHTGGDLVAFASGPAGLTGRAGAVFVGDLVEESAPPAYGDDCYPLDWPSCNERLLAVIPPEVTVVPGHGDVVDRAFVEHQLRALQQVAAILVELREAGVRADRALEYGRGRWPFPEQALTRAIRRAFED
jgi:glyoxylase-like metal-dependent hydrolase (beta-lactamase superfamily II)